MNKIINFDSITREEYDDNKIYLEKILGIDRIAKYKNKYNKVCLVKNVNVRTNEEQTKERYYMCKTKYLYNSNGRIRKIKTANYKNKYNHILNFKYTDDDNYAVIIKNELLKYKIEVLIKDNKIVYIHTDIFEFKCVYDKDKLVKTIFKDKKNDIVAPLKDNQLFLLYDICQYIGNSEIEYYDNGVKSVIRNKKDVLVNNVLDENGELIMHTNLYLGDMEVIYNDDLNEIQFSSRINNTGYIFDRETKKVKYVKENIILSIEEDHIVDYNNKILYMTKNNFKDIQIVSAEDVEVIGGCNKNDNNRFIASRYEEDINIMESNLDLIDYYLNICNLDFFIGIDSFIQRLEKTLNIYVL